MTINWKELISYTEPLYEKYSMQVDAITDDAIDNIAELLEALGVNMQDDRFTGNNPDVEVDTEMTDARTALQTLLEIVMMSAGIYCNGDPIKH